jgi:membrane protease YdiL (CAAX protease family)
MQTKPFYPTISQTWILLLIVLGFNLGASLLMLPLMFSGQNNLVMSLAELIAYVVTLGGTILFANKQFKKYNSKTTEPVHKLNMGVLALIVLLTPFMMVILDPLNVILPLPDWFENMIKDLIRPNAISFITIGIAPAILEEILCRGIVLKGMLKNYSPTKAILWSALFFGIFHMNPWQAVPAFIIGIALGWIYYRTRSLIPCMLIHAINNSTSFLLEIFYPDMGDSLYAFLGTQKFLLLFIASAAILVGGYFILNRLMPKPIKHTPLPTGFTPEQWDEPSLNLPFTEDGK